jgi:hypothetical protein
MRATVDQWEKLANEFGAEFLQKPETTRAMQQMSAGYLQMQKMTQDAIGKALAAANLPSRSDMEGLSARLGAIEASLARIEIGTSNLAGPARAPRPPRTRKPPVQS